MYGLKPPPLPQEERLFNPAAKYVVIGIVVIIVLFVIKTVFFQSSDLHEEENCVVIESKTGSHEYKYVTIEGTIKNVCDHQISYVKLEGISYNKDGVQVGSDWTYADSDHVPAGSISSFTIMIKVPDDTETYKVKVLGWKDY